MSNIGTWMSSVGSAWLMTSLSPSPMMIALVQTATTLPIFLFALPAGALADIFNRRQILIVINLIMLIAAILFALMVWRDSIDGSLLLLFTFIMGLGAAFSAPAWQAVVPQMVPKEDLAEAIALNGISINISRAIGPVLAGVLMAIYGTSSPFIANAFSFLVILVALFWWRYVNTTTQSRLPTEQLFSGMIAGVRYAANNSSLKKTMWHVAGFMFFANAFWGLLPLVSKVNLNGDSAFFGYLMGGVGIGAVLAAFLLPRIKAHFSPNQMVTIGTVGTALVTAYFSVAQSPVIAVLSCLIYGVSWILVLSSLNVSAQQSLPNWVKARGLAVFMLVFYGSMSLGAAFWGWIASEFTLDVTFIIASLGAFLFAAISHSKELHKAQSDDHMPSNHWPEPVIQTDLSHDRGPVIIQIEYRIAAHNQKAFLDAILLLRPLRQQHGAFNWGVYEQTDMPGVFIEHFKEHSWLEHLRHHERVTGSDKEFQDRVLALHIGSEKPKVTHLISNTHGKRV